MFVNISAAVYSCTKNKSKYAAFEYILKEYFGRFD